MLTISLLTAIFILAEAGVSAGSGIRLSVVQVQPAVLSTSLCSHPTPSPFVTFPRCPSRVPMKRNSPIGILAVNNLGLCVVVQLGLAFGMAGLLWPDKLMPFFEILMFPWAASRRAIRANGIAAIGLSLLLLVRRLAVHP